MTLADQPRFDLVHPTSLVAVWRSVVFTVWGFRPMTVPIAAKHVEVMEALGKSLGVGKIGVVALLDLDMPMPDADLRGYMDKAINRVAPYYGCAGTVFPGDGFRSALVRGVLSSFQLVAKQKYPMKVCSRYDECSLWMTPNLERMGMKVRSSDELAEAMTIVAQRARTEGVFGRLQ